MNFGRTLLTFIQLTVFVAVVLFGNDDQLTPRVIVDAFSPVTHTGGSISSSSRTTALGVLSSFPSSDDEHHRHSSSSSPSSHSSSNNNRNSEHPLNKHLPRDFRRRTEFTNLEPIEESSDRRRRINQEEINSEMFAKHGDELWALRKLQEKLSHKLVRAINTGLREREDEIREQLRHVERQDPEVVYKMELLEMQQAKNEGRDDDARMHSQKAYAARSCLPQYNLNGLWVGK